MVIFVGARSLGKANPYRAIRCRKVCFIYNAVRLSEAFS